MTEINRLSTIDNVSGGDQIPAYDQSAGTARKMSVSQLLAFFSANFASPTFAVEAYAPITGQTLTLSTSTSSIWLLLSPLADVENLTVTLPPVASLFDGQEVLLTTTEVVDVITFGGNGASVEATVSWLPANSAIKLRYNLASLTWYEVSRTSGADDILFSDPGLDVITLGTGGAELTLLASAITADGEFAGTGNAYFESGAVVFKTTTVSGLPAAASFSGGRAFVTNANATTFNSVVAAGGSNFVPVFSDGTNWRIG